ncbi:MATE family efflux transporter [Bradyrhizobium sp. CIR18]|uniref:MATE family efflux transporter n=1 Tax=Bradyrhizobium sp. CIR18 TaxID=2663839 RepID=UPI0016068537
MILSVGVTFAAGVACGAADGALVRRSVRIGLWVAILLWVPIMVCRCRASKLCLRSTHGPAIAQLAQQYLFGLAWEILPALWFLSIHQRTAGLSVEHRPIRLAVT